MGEKEFIKQYAEARGISDLKKAKKKIDLFWETMMIALEEEGEVKVKDWGSFRLKEVPERDIVQLRTKKLVKIPAGTKLKFKTGKRLQNIINNENKETGAEE